MEVGGSGGWEQWVEVGGWQSVVDVTSRPLRQPSDQARRRTDTRSCLPRVTQITEI